MFLAGKEKPERAGQPKWKDPDCIVCQKRGKLIRQEAKGQG